MKNINKIMRKLKEKSKRSKEDSEHFASLRKLIEQFQFEEAAASIVSKIEENNYWPSSYQKQLEFLLPHCHIASIEDEYSRTVDLLSAMDRGLAAVAEVLSTGSLIIINKESRWSHETPLTEAIIRRNTSVINYLIACGATNLTGSNINRPINDDKKTLLHIACELRDIHLVAMILSQTTEVNDADRNGVTALEIASNPDKGDPAIASLLINRGAIMFPDDHPVKTKKKNQPQSPFMEAMIAKDAKALTDMLQGGYQPNRVEIKSCKDIFPDFYAILNKPYRDRRNDAIQRSIFRQFKYKDSELKPLFEVIFRDNDEEKADLIKNIETLYYHQNTILKPLLDIALLASKKQHKAGIEKGKTLKILMTDNIDISEFEASREGFQGLYTDNNTVFIANVVLLHQTRLGTLLHELKHFSDKQVYNSSLQPYTPNEQSGFLEMKSQLKEQCERYFQSIPIDSSDIDRAMYSSIYSAFKLYYTHQQDAEVLVKVPEIIGHLGLDEGYGWLKKNVPFLLDYYENVFNPACENYLKEIAKPDQRNAP
jgi:hypothetical protein